MSQFFIEPPGGAPAIPTSFPTDSGTATPIGNQLNILGGAGITTSAPGPSNTVLISLDGGGIAFDEILVQASDGDPNPVVPSVTGRLTLDGEVVPAGTIPIQTNTPLPNTINIEIQMSQAILDPDETKVGLCNFDSTDFDVSPEGFVSISNARFSETIEGNEGGPFLGSWVIQTANSTPIFDGVDKIFTLDFGFSNLAIGNSMPALTSGGSNVSLGAGSSFLSISSGSNNTNVGYNSQVNQTTGSGNTSIGKNCLTTLATGSFNTALGLNCGNAYTTSESSNILIGALVLGTIGESNVCRIGNPAAGSGQILQTYIAGVINTVSGRVVKTTSPGAYPYTTLTTDYVILVDTSATRTINLISSPVTGTTYRIKDSVGSAAANNITITPAAGNIDGAASYVINNNYGSVDVVYSGTQWNKF